MLHCFKFLTPVTAIRPSHRLCEGIAERRLAGLHSRITEHSGRRYFLKSFAMRKKLVDVTGIEPVTPCLQSRCSPS